MSWKTDQTLDSITCLLANQFKLYQLFLINVPKFTLACKMLLQ